MELRDYVEVVRKRWRIVALVALSVLAAAAVWTILTPKTYAATTQFFVSTTAAGDTNAASLQQGNTFTQARVKSYTQLLTSPKVLDPVIADAGLDISAEALAKQISAAVPLDTVVIEVTVTGASPEQARTIAASLDTIFPRTLSDIERLDGTKASPVKVTVVQQATADAAPVTPRPARNLVLGTALGLLLGLGLALLRETLDQRIRSAREVSAVTDATVIGGIAYDADAPEHPLIVQVDPRSPRAEAFRSLRTNLQFVNVADPPRSIVVTSSIAGEGKSTTAANLAISLSDAGKSVVIIEGDLRRPRLLEYLGFEGAVGLTDVLVGRLTVEETLQQFGRSRLWMLGSGPIPPNPSELLGSSRMADLIDALTATFDYVIVDAPPLLPVTDAAVVSTVVDGALVVVGAEVVTRDQLRHALAALESVSGNLLGVILNRLPAGGNNAYGTYSYRYEAEPTRGKAKGRTPAAARRPVVEPEADPDASATPDLWDAPKATTVS
ncbi:MAG: Chromosome partitioning protein [Humibacillus sp.]|nr:Chromosome partitioning protein [Humibacillus sp.]